MKRAVEDFGLFCLAVLLCSVLWFIAAVYEICSRMSEQANDGSV